MRLSNESEKNNKKSNTGKIKRVTVVVCFIICFVLLVGGYYVYTFTEISDKSIVVYTGYEKTISISGRHDKENWYSDDEKIAVVTDGKIKALTKGKTEIHVDIGDKIFTCEVDVKESLSPKYYKYVEDEKSWILSQQLSNGALPIRRGKDNEVSINPYFSCISMINILNCEPSASDIQAVKRYIEWHMEHINDIDKFGVSGTIYDYKAVIDEETGECIEKTDETYDSTDSYAAMFLVLLNEYRKYSGDLELLMQNMEIIRGVYFAMVSTLTGNYTYAKPDYEIKYLMDNTEVYAGLKAAKELFGELYKENGLNDSQVREDEIYVSILEALDGFIENFEGVWWNGENYFPGLDINNNAESDDFSWKNFYVDAVSQLSPCIYDIGNEKNNMSVYSRFCDEWEWEKLDFIKSEKATFYWGQMAYAAVKMGDNTRAIEYIEKFVDETRDRNYPLICMDSSWVARTSRSVADKYKKIELAYAD